MEGLVNSYKGKRVFITGHTGFKGSWLLLWLHSCGAIVKGYALAPETKDSLYYLFNGDELCDSVIHDIRDQNELEKELLSFEPDFIFHLAAQPLVRLSYEIPEPTFEVNVMGTINVLEALRKLKKPCSVIVITTDKVYDNIEKDYAYQEDDKLGGFDPYSASKAAAEIAVSSYRSSFFNSGQLANHRKGLAVARSGNVIGGGDRSKDRIIPDIISALENQSPIGVRNPNSIRPWQFILEPLLGYLLLGKELAKDPRKFSTAFNFGPELEDTLTVEHLVQQSIHIWGGGKYKKTEDPNSVHEAGLLMLDNNKAKRMLNFYPKYRSAEAIEKTILWYKYAKNDYRKYSLEQINQYIN